MRHISATIITFNEEHRIKACLASLDGIADEIIVVDSFSTDRTAEICSEHGCKVVKREFPGYGAQRQFATSLTTHSYVLSIDADEVLSPALRNTIIINSSVVTEISLIYLYGGIVLLISLTCSLI